MDNMEGRMVRDIERFREEADSLILEVSTPKVDCPIAEEGSVTAQAGVL